MLLKYNLTSLMWLHQVCHIANKVIAIIRLEKHLASFQDQNMIPVTLANDQLDAQIFNTFITVLYMYMFRAISCSSSGGRIVLTQHLVSSLSVSDRSVHRLRKSSFSTCTPDGHLLTVTIPDAELIQFDLLRMSKISLETCTCRGV